MGRQEGRILGRAWVLGLVGTLAAGCASSLELDVGADSSGIVLDPAESRRTREIPSLETRLLDSSILERSLVIGAFPLYALRLANDMEERIVERDYEDHRQEEKWERGRAEDESERMEELLGSPQPVARRKALSELRSAGPGEHYFLVLELLRDPDDQVRYLAMEVLAAYWKASSLPRLAEVFEKDPDLYNRVMAVRQLQAFPADDAVPVLVLGLQRERSGRVRMAIVVSLSRFPEDRRVLSALVDSLEDSEKAVRDEAFHKLYNLTGQDFGFDPFADPGARQTAVESWREWLSRQR